MPLGGVALRESPRLARALRAEAFAHGSDIVTRGPAAERTIAHEAVHVAQQRRTGRAAVERIPDVTSTAVVASEVAVWDDASILEAIDLLRGFVDNSVIDDAARRGAHENLAVLRREAWTRGLSVPPDVAAMQLGEVGLAGITAPFPEFVCDPALPPRFEVMVPGPDLGDGRTESETVAVDAQIAADMPLTFFAVPMSEVFETPEEAANPTCAESTDETPAWLGVGSRAYTRAGSIEVRAVSPGFVVTTTYASLAVGAAACNFVETSGGPMLVDAGAQIRIGSAGLGMPDAALANAAVARIVELLGGRPLERAWLTHAHADHINLLPLLASQVEIRGIRITAAQATRPLFRQILAATQDASRAFLRDEVPRRVRARLDPTRAQWLERQGPAVNATPERAAAAWDTYVNGEIEVARAAVQAPFVELLVGTPEGPGVVRAELVRSPDGRTTAATPPAGTPRGSPLRTPVTDGPVITFAHPDADSTGTLEPDRMSANYIVDIEGGTRLIVIADPRDVDLAGTVENFRAAVGAAGPAAKVTIVSGTHHAQRGFMTLDGVHLADRQFLVDATKVLAELADSIGPDGRPTGGALVVGGAEGRISPGNIWLLRQLGFDAYVATSTNEVNLVRITTVEGGDVSGLSGDPRGGGRPASPELQRGEMELVRLERAVAADASFVGPRTPEEQAEVLAREVDIATLRGLLHRYMDAFNIEIGRGSNDPTRPGVAPAPGVEPAAAELRALVEFLDARGAPAGVSGQAALSQPMLVIARRVPDANLTPRQRALRASLTKLTDLDASLRPGEVTGAKRLELIAAQEEAAAQLRHAAADPTNTPEQAELLRTEAGRLEAAALDVRRHLRTTVVSTPDPRGGGRTVTRLTFAGKMNSDVSPRRQWLEPKFEAAGKGFGAVMITQSLKAGVELTEEMIRGEASALQGIVGLAHDAYGVSIGLRMVQLTHVHPGEFVLHAVLDVGTAMARDYASDEQRDLAIASSVTENGVNLVLMAIGMAMMKSGNAGIAGGGFVVMMLGGAVVSLLRAVGFFDFLERMTSFDPGDVTDVRQELRDLMSQYRTVLGAIELAKTRRVSDPLATATIEQHRREALALEPSIVEEFGEGYATARGAHSGLRALDEMREMFANYRRRAFEDWTAEPDALTKWNADFQAMERQLDLSESPMDVQTLPQWASIERQLTKLEEASADATVDDFDREEFQEELTELDRMFENARYRVRPADQGGYRPTPLMREGTPARVLYDTFLTGYERRYEAVLDSAAAFGGGAFICTAPARPLERLTGARRHYETALESLAIKLPKARIDELWTASELLSYRYDKLLADTQTGDALDQLGLQEQALRAMAAQAQSTSAKSPDASAIGTAVQAIHDAIARRQEELGIPLRSEIEAFANRIGAAENQAIAIALGGPIEGQISDLQREALKSDELEDVAGRIHTPRSQLARVVEERRGRAAGRFALYTPRDAAHQPEFAVLAYTGESNDEDSVGCGGHYSLWKMVAINDEAVSLFGSEPRMAKPWDLTPITAAEILARAKPPQAR